MFKICKSIWLRVLCFFVIISPEIKGGHRIYMKIQVSDFIANFLVENGISDMFTVTGGGAMFLNNSFGHKEGLCCTYNHHEQASAICAEGYFRATGKLPAICVTTGPGGTNALTGVLGSWLDSIPMFVISGQVKFSTTIKSTTVPLRQLGDQEFNIVDCVKTMTKYAVMVTDPLTIKYHLKKALYIATHGRMGPVWLDIPINVQSAQIETDDLIDYDESEDKAQIPPKPDNKQMELLVQKLTSSKRPVILVGEGVWLGKAVEDFYKLAEKFNIPVVTAWNAHDLFEDAHPLNCGKPGTVGTRGGNLVLQNADFVLSLGCRMNIRQISYNWENFAKNAYLAYVDIDENELNKPTLNVDLKIHADVKDVIAKLMQSNFTANKEQQLWLNNAKAINNKYSCVRNFYKNNGTNINPYLFMEKFGNQLLKDATVACGNGSACVVTFQALNFKKGQRIFTNSGCASMGYGLPAAVGACVALKGKKVYCLDGDGSIQMNLQELQTVVHNNLNLTIFWLNNDGYHSIRQTQTSSFNSNFCGVSSDSGISFPSAEKIANAYGLKFFKIDKADEVDEKLNEALSFNGAAICEVVLDKTQFFAPKLSSKRFPDGTIVSPSLEDMFPFLDETEMQDNIKKLKGE